MEPHTNQRFVLPSDENGKARDRVERLKAEVVALKKLVGEREDHLRAAQAEARGATAELKRLSR